MNLFDVERSQCADNGKCYLLGELLKAIAADAANQPSPASWCRNLPSEEKCTQKKTWG